MNTDRALVLQFLQDGRKPAAITSNPLARELGGALLELDTDRREALLAFEPSPRFAQGTQVLQGGIVATLLDFAMAFAAHATLAAEERPFATATLAVSLLRPAPPGRYLARGRIIRAGRSLLFASGELTAGADGKTIATASGVMPLSDA